MKVKNISGTDQYFRFGKRGLSIADQAIAEIASDNNPYAEDEQAEAFRDALNYASLSLIEIVEGPQQVRHQGGKSGSAYGWIYFSGQPTDGEKVTVGNTVYAFTDGTYTPTADEVGITIGASATADITALKTAVNDNADSDVVAGDIVNDILSVSAVEEGSDGNTIPLLSTVTASTLSGATLANGYLGAVITPVYFTHTVTAAEAAASDVIVPTGLESISSYMITQTVDASSTIQFPAAGTLAINNGTLVFDNAANDYAVDDVLTIVVFS